jgi:hypothetical protein
LRSFITFTIDFFLSKKTFHRLWGMTASFWRLPVNILHQGLFLSLGFCNSDFPLEHSFFRTFTRHSSLSSDIYSCCIIDNLNLKWPPPITIFPSSLCSHHNFIQIWEGFLFIDLLLCASYKRMASLWGKRDYLTTESLKPSIVPSM